MLYIRTVLLRKHFRKIEVKYNVDKPIREKHHCGKNPTQ
jgi:hypothetical protein